MLKIKHLFLVFSLAVLCNSCKKGHEYDLFKTTGPVETRTREVSDFDRIELHDNMDVYLSYGPKFEVKLEAGKNLHSGIVSDVSGTTLILKNENVMNILRSHEIRIKFYITMPYIKNIDHLGVGTIQFDNRFTQDTLRVKATSTGDTHVNIDVKYFSTSSHGGGDIYMAGYADRSYHYMYGTNFIYANDLNVKNYRFIETISIGHCYLKTQGDTLEANIWADGNIYYTGLPSVIKYQQHAKGDILKEQ